MTENGNFRQRTVERRFRRSLGISPEHRQAIREHHEEKSDWFATCARCKRSLTGTIAELKAHQCEERDAAGH